MAVRGHCGLRTTRVPVPDSYKTSVHALFTTVDTVVNAKVGVRIGFGALALGSPYPTRSDLYVGYGRSLTGEVWYKNLVRVEYRMFYCSRLSCVATGSVGQASPVKVSGPLYRSRLVIQPQTLELPERVCRSIAFRKCVAPQGTATARERQSSTTPLRSRLVKQRYTVPKRALVGGAQTFQPEHG